MRIQSTSPRTPINNTERKVIKFMMAMNHQSINIGHLRYDINSKKVKDKDIYRVKIYDMSHEEASLVNEKEFTITNHDGTMRRS